MGSFYFGKAWCSLAGTVWGERGRRGGGEGGRLEWEREVWGEVLFKTFVNRKLRYTDDELVALKVHFSTWRVENLICAIAGSHVGVYVTRHRHAV